MLGEKTKRFIVRGWDGEPDYDGECDHEYCETEKEALEMGQCLEGEYDFIEIYDTEKNRFL